MSMKKGHAQVWAASALLATIASWSVFGWIAGQAPKIDKLVEVCGTTCATYHDRVVVFGSAQFAALLPAIGSTVLLVATLINLASAYE